MTNNCINSLLKIHIRCWDINKTRQGITFICRTLYIAQYDYKVRRQKLTNPDKDMHRIRAGSNLMSNVGDHEYKSIVWTWCQIRNGYRRTVWHAFKLPLFISVFAILYETLYGYRDITRRRRVFYCYYYAHTMDLDRRLIGLWRYGYTTRIHNRVHNALCQMSLLCNVIMWLQEITPRKLCYIADRTAWCRRKFR